MAHCQLGLWQKPTKCDCELIKKSTQTSKCVNNCTMLVHQPVFHIATLLYGCEWSTSDAHQLVIQLWINANIAPPHNISNLDSCSMFLVLIILNSLCSYCLLIHQIAALQYRVFHNQWFFSQNIEK